jgi:glutathione-regulated potassium-efflux system ancillary protein KefG
VLEHGWAYGRNGRMLEGKKIFHMITSGGRAESYRHDGYNAYTIPDFLRPIERTAKLCRMEYWPPYVIHGTHRMDQHDIIFAAGQYAGLLSALSEDKIVKPGDITYLNELLPTLQSN